MRPTPPRHRATAAPDPYANLPGLYDLEHAGFADDLSLYRNLAEIVGDPILELGCGSGRILRPLARAGWRVTGIDQSPEMLEAATVAIAADGLSGNVRLVRSDLIDAASAPGGPFGLVILGLNGLMHLSTQEAQRDCLVAARRALDPRGQLVIDVINPTPDLLHGFERGVVHEGRWELDDGGVVDKFGSRHVSPTSQQIETHLWYDTVNRAGAVRRIVSEFTLRYMHQPELALMLELAGFVECQYYGGYDLDPFEDTSERLIVTADVSPSPPGPVPT